MQGTKRSLPADGYVPDQVYQRIKEQTQPGSAGRIAILAACATTVVAAIVIVLLLAIGADPQLVSLALLAVIVVNSIIGLLWAANHTG